MSFMNIPALPSAKQSESDHDLEIQKIVETSRSLLPSEVWDYISGTSHSTIEPDISFSVVQTSTETTDVPCLPMQIY